MAHFENADATRPLTAVARSVAAWYEFECDRLQRERRLFRENLTDAELDRAMEENAVEQKALDDGWANSSLRRHIDERAQQHAAGGSPEHRVGLAAPAGPGLAVIARATSTTMTAKSIFGHGAVFNKWADIGYFREQIAPGAFAAAIKASDVRCLFNHEANYVFGRTSANTLELEEDRIGLAFRCYLLSFDAGSYALARRIDRRDLSGCSFSFTVKRDSWKLAQKPGDLDERTILEIGTLYDVGPVTYPAYPQTDVQAIFEKTPRSAAPAPEDDDRRMTADEYFADADEEIKRIDRERDRQRRSQEQYDYQSMGFILDAAGVPRSS